MTLSEMAEAAQRQIDIAGPNASVSFTMPGRWGVTNRRKLCRGGPSGDIVGDLPGGRIIVMFTASEVIEFVRNKEGL